MLPICEYAQEGTQQSQAGGDIYYLVLPGLNVPFQMELHLLIHPVCPLPFYHRSSGESENKGEKRVLADVRLLMAMHFRLSPSIRPHYDGVSAVAFCPPQASFC